MIIVNSYIILLYHLIIQSPCFIYLPDHTDITVRHKKEEGLPQADPLCRIVSSENISD